MSSRIASSATLSRRATLKGAGLAVGTLWVVPIIQVISMDSAAAASAPPTRVQPGSPQGSTLGDGSVGQVSAESATTGSVSAESALPKTGSDGSAGLTAAGLGSVAVGAAAVIASRRMRKARPADASPAADA